MKTEWNKGWRFRGTDGTWKEVTLPHDAMQEEKRDPAAGSGSAGGFYPGGRYTYCREMRLSEGDLCRHYTLEFEGVYKDAKVYVNDQYAGGCAYGYLPFAVEMDAFLKSGANEIRVETDNALQPDSRWYTGAGIYRPVWLCVEEDIRFVRGSIRIETVSLDPARILVKAAHTGGSLTVEVREPATGGIAASGAGVNADAAGGAGDPGSAAVTDRIGLTVPQARLWDADDPYLYDVVLRLSDGERIVEEVCIPFGIRMLSWKGGFFVNGKKTLLKGGCIHHDNGILGACEYPESADRKIVRLKEAGFNAIRSAHNPCSEAILSACDRHGMYVMDETWDMWGRKKNPYDYASVFAEHYREDIRAIVERDCVHACVVMYSIGNEVSEPAWPEGVELAREMVDLFHSLDSTRPVTGGMNLMIIKNAAKGNAVYKEDGGLSESQSPDMSGMNSTMFNMIASATGSSMNKSANGKKADALVSPVLDLLDICGYNYSSGRYREDLRLHPDRLILGSETFPQDLSENWEMVRQLPNLVGDFMWTAWDYLGEAGLGAWSYEKDAKGFSKPYPWLLADAGAYDILGNPTGELLRAKGIWGESGVPQIGVRPCSHPGGKLIRAAWRGTNALPSWSWSGCEGNKTAVEVYTTADTVILELNGKRVGKKKAKKNCAVFKLRYQPGTLTAIACDASGNEIGRSGLKSAQGPVSVVLSPEKKEARAGEICYIDIQMADPGGTVDSNCDERIELSVSGGELLGAGSANPKTEDSFRGAQMTTWYGRGLAVVRAGEAGLVKITARGERTNAECEIQIR